MSALFWTPPPTGMRVVAYSEILFLAQYFSPRPSLIPSRPHVAWGFAVPAMEEFAVGLRFARPSRRFVISSSRCATSFRSRTRRASMACGRNRKSSLHASNIEFRYFALRAAAVVLHNAYLQVARPDLLSRLRNFSSSISLFSIPNMRSKMGAKS